jgi:hypothetical protein
MWRAFSITAIALLIIFFMIPKRNAVWGGATIGAIVGLIIAIIFLFKGDGFNWSIIWRGIVIGILSGAIAELLGMFGDYLKKKMNKKQSVAKDEL